MPFPYIQSTPHTNLELGVSAEEYVKHNARFYLASSPSSSPALPPVLLHVLWQTAWHPGSWVREVGLSAASAAVLQVDGAVRGWVALGVAGGVDPHLAQGNWACGHPLSSSLFWRTSYLNAQTAEGELALNLRFLIYNFTHVKLEFVNNLALLPVGELLFF